MAEYFILGEGFVVITRQLQAAEWAFKAVNYDDKSSFVKFFACSSFYFLRPILHLEKLFSLKICVN
jgi:hypothetical protein